MAETKSTFHARSNSLPSRPHPIVSDVEEQLCRLKSAEATSTSSSSSSIFHKLNNLQDLHDAVDKLLQLPQTQHILSQQQGIKSVDKLLDGTLLLLDMCTAAKDALMQSTQSINELQSMLRKKHMVELTMEAKKQYLTSRKTTKKAVLKVLRTLKGLRHHEDNLCSPEKDKQEMSMITMLKEVEAVTMKSLESLLFFVSGSKARSMRSKWSFVGKLVQSKRVASISEETDENEIQKLDMELQHLLCHKATSTNLHNHMENTKSCMIDLEEETENLLRRLIKTRVALLNILSS